MYKVYQAGDSPAYSGSLVKCVLWALHNGGRVVRVCGMVDVASF